MNIITSCFYPIPIPNNTIQDDRMIMQESNDIIYLHHPSLSLPILHSTHATGIYARYFLGSSCYEILALLWDFYCYDLSSGGWCLAGCVVV